MNDATRTIKALQAELAKAKLQIGELKRTGKAYREMTKTYRCWFADALDSHAADNLPQRSERLALSEKYRELEGEFGSRADAVLNPTPIRLAPPPYMSEEEIEDFINRREHAMMETVYGRGG